MNEILIKGGSLVSLSDNFNFNKLDILIKDGLIKKIAKNIESETAYILDARNKIVSPGLIDIHTHVFTNKGKEGLGVNADLIGVQRGTTTVIDAGSAGPLNIKEFINKVVLKNKTKVYSLLNISKQGLVELNELNSLEKIDEGMIYEAIDKYSEYIVGLKARASSSVVEDLGITPIKIACKISAKAELPIMIHTGNFPPYLEDVLNLMKKGDILTHAFHGKKGGLLEKDEKVIDEAIAARKRGVLFDVGHGSASYSFKTFLKAKDLGFYTDFVSTDIHTRNYKKVVHSQHDVITKLINCSEDLAETLRKATSAPADHFKLNKLGHLKVGYIADISISEIVSSNETVEDSIGNKLKLSEKFLPYKTIISNDRKSEVIING